MNRTSQAISAAVLALTAAAWAASGAERASESPIVATVGSLSITREDLDHRARPAIEAFEQRSRQPVTTEIQQNIERQVLETLIRDRLLLLESQRRGLTVKDAEAEEIVKKAPIFNPNGVFNARGYEAAKVNSPELFQRAMAQARSDVAARRLGEQLKNSSVPSDDRLRAEAERTLARTAIEYLALNRAQFTGDYPEPHESEVLAYYRDHMSEFRRPARAELSVITLEPPQSGEPAARKQADSLLAELRGGVSFDSAATAFGGARGNVVVLPGNFPGSWRVAPRLQDLVFRTPPGTVLPEPVPSADGWLIVRVEESAPAGIAPLGEATPEIRQSLRDDLRRHFEDRQIAALYQSERDSLARRALRLRYVAVDTTRLEPGEPTDQDLDRYYRGHQADYTTYDPKAGELVVTPLAQVRQSVRLRWRQEQRSLRSHLLAEQVQSAWNRGQRDRSAENAAGGAREVGPFPLGAPADSSLAGQVLGDTLATQPPERGAWVIPYPRGAVVYQVLGEVERFVPSLQQVRDELVRKYQERRRAQNYAEAHALFEKNPAAFMTGNVVYYSSLIIALPDILQVPLTRQEVERYHREHLDKYASTEKVRARHILISPSDPSPEADRQAREQAEALLSRIRAGEDFATLARRYSDDPATKPEGGDLGYFGRGAMLDAVERAAFSLKPGEVSDVIKSEVGYPILRVMDYQPLVADPLPLVYANVGADAAAEKAERMARRLADSLSQVVHTPAQAIAASTKLGLQIEPSVHIMGNRAYPAEDMRRAYRGRPRGDRRRNRRTERT